MLFARTGVEPERRANRDPNLAPHGVYGARGKDRWLAIAVEGDGEWRRLAEAIDRPDLARDPRFATHEARKANEDALDAIVERWTRGRDAWEAAEHLQSHRVAAPAVESIADQLDRDPCLREHFQVVHQPADGGLAVLVNGEPIRFEGLDPRLGRSPGLREHNEYVFRDVVGLGEEEFEALMVDGVIM